MSQNGTKLLAEWEGLRTEVYDDAAGLQFGAIVTHVHVVPPFRSSVRSTLKRGPS